MAKVPILDISETEYKIMMRKRYKALKKAMMGEFMPGCAYVPLEARRELGKMFASFEKSLRICKSWWRGV
jgi:hypothetical protein